MVRGMDHENMHTLIGVMFACVLIVYCDCLLVNICYLFICPYPVLTRLYFCSVGSLYHIREDSSFDFDGRVV